MNILIVAPEVRGYGVQRVVSLLSREWAKSHEVTIATFDASEAVSIMEAASSIFAIP